MQSTEQPTAPLMDLGMADHCPECRELTVDGDGDPVYEKEHPFCSDSCVARHYARKDEDRAVAGAAARAQDLPPDLRPVLVEVPVD